MRKMKRRGKDDSEFLALEKDTNDVYFAGGSVTGTLGSCDLPEYKSKELIRNQYRAWCIGQESKPVSLMTGRTLPLNHPGSQELLR